MKRKIFCFVPGIRTRSAHEVESPLTPSRLRCVWCASCFAEGAEVRVQVRGEGPGEEQQLRPRRVAEGKDHVGEVLRPAGRRPLRDCQVLGRQDRLPCRGGLQGTGETPAGQGGRPRDSSRSDGRAQPLRAAGDASVL